MSAQVTSNEIPIHAFELMKTLTQIYIHALSVEGIPQLIFLETVKRTGLVIKRRVEDVRKQLCKASNGPPGGCTLVLELMNILPSTAKEVKVPYGIKFSSQSTLETVDYLGGQNVITVLLRVCKGGRKENTGTTI